MNHKGFKHISSRLFFSFILMAFLTVAILWLVQAGLMRNSYVNSKIKTVKAAIENSSTSSVEDIEEKSSASLLIFDQNGDLTYRSQGMPMMGMMQRSAQSMLPLQDFKTDFVDASHLAIRYAILGMPMDDGSTVFAVFSLADADAASELLRQQLWFITIILIVMAAIISALLAKRFSVPVRNLTNAADRVAQGEYDISLEVNSADELGVLTASLNKMVTQLKKNDQLQKELIANVSHELKAPLTIIRGYAETVRDVSWSDDKKRTAHLDLIISESDRLKSIVQDILDYSQLQAGTIKLQPETFSIRSVLNKILSTLEQYTDKRKISIKVSGSDAITFFDKRRLEQVFFNLIVNAIQHADSASEIIIDLEPIYNQDTSILRFSVSNQGDTIPKTELANIWERFHRSEQLRADSSIGTGLGLAIVRSIMNQHNANYGVSSDNGRTIFWLDLPLIS